MYINLGSGYSLKKGFYNLDQHINTHFYSHNTATINWTAPNVLPFEDDSVEFVYSSHFLEHLHHQDAIAVLSEIKRICKPSAKFRVALPDAKSLIMAYVNNDSKELDKWASQKPLKYRLRSHFKPIIPSRVPMTKEHEALMNIDNQMSVHEHSYKSIHDFAKAIAEITNVRERLTKPSDINVTSPIDQITHLLHQSNHQQLYDLAKISIQCKSVGFNLIGESDYDPSIDEPDLKSISFYAVFK